MVKGRILLVEDEILLHYLWEDICGDLDIEIVGPAVTNQQALDLIASEGHDLTGVILDVNLQCETSQGAAVVLANMDIPVVVCSGSHTGDLPAVYEKWPVLWKPYRPSAITAHLANLVYSSDK
jgi:CheY-like chemotaxis protein